MKFKTYLLSYNYQGAQWSAEIKAASFDDARSRLRSLGLNGQVDGELIARIPANTITHFPVSILLPVIVATRNFLHRLFRTRP
ncbi:hypothetical protein [Sphingosinicella ginsenosidimutans]|uniref:Uncharacterized protein n=1 Tax=Allosphingosinicella ginsenosidimutans TaxID=1176539 RepID=A0A5C6TUW5_9SPHN|nr:hypothetical protein [Sphingosinicella ginsenosidimutans]TXC63910.1 hypothetical protein FRZ32_09725 [Sphingosinicella ginsenosidimutans]